MIFKVVHDDEDEDGSDDEDGGYYVYSPQGAPQGAAGGSGGSGAPKSLKEKNQERASKFYEKNVPAINLKRRLKRHQKK